MECFLSFGAEHSVFQRVW